MKKLFIITLILLIQSFPSFGSVDGKGIVCKCLECNKAIRKSKKNYGVLCSECLKDMNNYVYVGNWKCCFYGIYKNKRYQYIWNVDCDYLIRLYNNRKITSIKVNKWIKLEIYKKDFM